MKRAVIALVIGAFAFVAVALAAGLTVTNSSLGAGVSVTASCDLDGVTPSYTTAYSSGSYKVTAVNVAGVDTTALHCSGKTVNVTLTDSSNNSIGSGSTGPLATGGSSVTVVVPMAPQPAASVVTATAIAIG